MSFDGLRRSLADSVKNLKKPRELNNLAIILKVLIHNGKLRCCCKQIS